MSRAALVRALVPAYLTAIVGIPMLVVVALFVMADSAVSSLLAAAVAIPMYGVVYVGVAGALSCLTRAAIVAGRFPRDLGHAVYGPRRLYALCWTAVYYWTPLYHAVLGVSWLRKFTLRMFGYTGSLDFQTYPDTWLRDLPLLDVGSGAYLSNKATISPNMCQRDGTIIVLPVKIGARTMVGHLTMVAPGVSLEDDVEIGVGVCLGVKASIGAGSMVGHGVVIDHQVRIGSDCDVGTRAYIGRRAQIADGLRIPPGMVVPAKSILRSQAEVDSVAARMAPMPLAQGSIAVAC